MTRAHMTIDQLATNYALKGLIEKWRETNQGVVAPKKQPGAPVKVASAPNATITLDTVVAPHPMEKDQEIVRVTVNPPAEGERRPAVVIALLDESVRSSHYCLPIPCHFIYLSTFSSGIYVSRCCSTDRGSRGSSRFLSFGLSEALYENGH
jgi:hypothetical protein